MDGVGRVWVVIIPPFLYYFCVENKVTSRGKTTHPEWVWNAQLAGLHARS